MVRVSDRTPNGCSILALNCGSSSLKFGLYICDGRSPRLVCEGEAEEIGKQNSSFSFKPSRDRDTSRESIRVNDHTSALEHALEVLRRCGDSEPEAVGHRFVHGGPRIREHQRVTQAVLEELRSAVDYAPLHVPSALAVLKAVQQALPRAPEFVCLDTAFHATMPDVAKAFALPEEVRRLGVERYGFHGLSIESILDQLRPCSPRLIIAHLGNGASITAVRDGRSIDTTMGLTPTGGVMMGTRCGDLDPGAAIYLMRHGYGTPEALESLFDRRSGLLGISGATSDVRELLSARKQNSQADLALRMFCYQVRKAIAEMAAALGGIDTLVFTGGIGEHATEVRNEICSGLRFLGDFQVLVLPAQEDLQIARITATLLDENT
jgi:acetate kinase